jgi:hypothetical protein
VFLLLSLKVNNLGKAAVLHFAFFCGWGHAKLSLPIILHSCAYVKFSQAFHNLLSAKGHQPMIPGSPRSAFSKWLHMPQPLRKQASDPIQLLVAQEAVEQLILRRSAHSTPEKHIFSTAHPPSVLGSH